MTDKNHNFRCDDCGRFISLSDLEDKVASRKLLTPDSEFTKEEYITLCAECLTLREEWL